MPFGKIPNRSRFFLGMASLRNLVLGRYASFYERMHRGLSREEAIINYELCFDGVCTQKHSVFRLEGLPQEFN